MHLFCYSFLLHIPDGWLLAREVGSKLEWSQATHRAYSPSKIKKIDKNSFYPFSIVLALIRIVGELETIQADFWWEKWGSGSTGHLLIKVYIQTNKHSDSHFTPIDNLESSIQADFWWEKWDPPWSGHSSIWGNLLSNIHIDTNGQFRVSTYTWCLTSGSGQPITGHTQANNHSHSHSCQC